MKIRTSITGVGTDVRVRSQVLIALAIAKREADLASAPPRDQNAENATRYTTSSRGGK